MKCIIIGAGKVGYSIASTLAGQGHDIIVIDIDREHLDIVEESLDVQVIEGNGANLSVLQQAGLVDTDMLVAVTEGDELNMVACFIAKSWGVPQTVARVREPGYASFGECHEKLGIDLIINPEKVAALEILKLIHYPEARNVKFFADGKVLMLELQVGENISCAGQSLEQINFPRPCVIVGIQRGKNIIVPRGRNTLELGDIIYLMAATSDMADIEEYLGNKHRKISNIMIFGGDLQARYLAEFLERDKATYHVKIIENDPILCENLVESLEHTSVIRGGTTDLKLLEDENVGGMDICVALTDDDKENVLISILAKELGAKKALTYLRRSDYIPLIERVGIDRAISPRSLTAAAILRFISHGHLRSLSFLQDERLQIAEIEIADNARVAGEKLKDLRIPHNSVVGVIFRSGEVIIPSGDTKIMVGDYVVVMALAEVLADAQHYLTRR